jgi:hypothetical protein
MCLSSEHVTGTCTRISYGACNVHSFCGTQRCGFTQHIADGALWSYYNKGRRYYSKDLTSYTSLDDAAASAQSGTTAETLEYQ